LSHLFILYPLLLQREFVFKLVLLLLTVPLIALLDLLLHHISLPPSQLDFLEHLVFLPLQLFHPDLHHICLLVREQLGNFRVKQGAFIPYCRRTESCDVWGLEMVA